MAVTGVDKNIDMRNSDEPSEPGGYSDMTIQLPIRERVNKKILAKLDKEYARLSNKQKGSYLRSVYYRPA